MLLRCIWLNEEDEPENLYSLHLDMETPLHLMIKKLYELAQSLNIDSHVNTGIQWIMIIRKVVRQ